MNDSALISYESSDNSSNDDGNEVTCYYHDIYYRTNVSKQSIQNENKYEQWETELYESLLFKITKRIQYELNENGIQLLCTFHELYEKLHSVTKK